MESFYKKQEELSDLNKLEQEKYRQRQDLEKQEQLRRDRELKQKRELAQETRNTLLLTEQEKTLEIFFKTIQASYTTATQITTSNTPNILTSDRGTTECPSTPTQYTKRTRSPTHSPDRPAPSVRCSSEDNEEMSV